MMIDKHVAFGADDMRMKDLSISKKMILSLVVFVITPLILIAMVINIGAYKVIDDKSNALIHQALKQTGQNIANILSETEGISTSLLADPEIQAMSKAYMEGQLLLFESAKREAFFSIESLLKNKPYFNSVSISNQGTILYQYGEKVNYESTSYDEVVKNLAGKAIWIPDYTLNNRIDGSSAKQVISLKRVINDLNMYNRNLSILRLSLDEDYVFKMFSDLNTWENSTISLFDQTGTVISSTDRTLLNQNMANAAFMTEVNQFTSGYTNLKMNNRHYMMYKYTIEPLGWQIIQILPVKELRSETVIINAFVAFTIGLCVVFGLAFYIFQRNTIINPLRKLSREIKKVKRGQFEVGLDIKSNDEIGMISFAFLDMARKLERLIEEEYKSKVREKEAHIQVLESQINPHFLYNTLDSIRWQALMNQDAAVAEQVEALANIFRHVLNKGQSMTTIREEIQYLENYLLIFKNRFGDNIQVDIEVDEALMEDSIQKLLLQPLVENSLIHGLGHKKGIGHIQVTIFKSNDLIHCKVTDNGVGVDQEKLQKIIYDDNYKGKSIALRNVHQRLQYKYGPDYGLTIHSELGRGTTASFSFPAAKYSEGDD